MCVKGNNQEMGLLRRAACCFRLVDGGSARRCGVRRLCINYPNVIVV